MPILSILAQKIEISGQVIEGPLKYNNVGEVINGLLNYFVFPVAGILLFVMIVLSGFDLLFSGGDPKKLTNGKNRLTYAIVGFVLLGGSFLITRLVAYVLRAPSGIL